MDYFPNIIGQHQVKEQLGMYIDAHLNGLPLPHFLLVGPGGVGKTHIAQQLAKGLNRSLVKVDGTAIKSKKQIIEQALMPIQQLEATVLFDEIGEVDPKILQMFLPILDKVQSRKTQVMCPDGNTLNFDFYQQNFIFATTDVQRLSRPLRTRMKEINLEDYSQSDLIKILKLNSPRTQFEDGALEELVKYSRGDGRWAFEQAEGIEVYCSAKGEDVFRREHLDNYNRMNGIYEHGLNRNEVKMLRILKEYPQGITLKILAARTKLDPKAQQELEKYPESKGLMMIDGKRKITTDGVKYLQGLEQNGRI